MFEAHENRYMLKLVRMHLALLVGKYGIECVVQEINEAGFFIGYWTIDDVARFLWSGETPCGSVPLCDAVLYMATQ